MLRWLRRLLTVSVTVILMGVWAVTFRPTSLGGPATYITVSGQSMLPTLRSGDLVVLRERSTYRPGDIVAFRIPAGEPGSGNRVIHRIVGGSGAEGYVTRGDNRTSDDLWRPRDADVLGKLWLRAPGAGALLPRLRAPLIVASAAAALAVWLVFDWWKKPKAEE
ncbi:MAG: signal peptidase I [Dehalococcoidia bacterium]|nr:signal peptidase I [Dehalococcoidia bacterium]